MNNPILHNSMNFSNFVDFSCFSSFFWKIFTNAFSLEFFISHFPSFFGFFRRSLRFHFVFKNFSLFWILWNYKVLFLWNFCGNFENLWELVEQELVGTWWFCHFGDYCEFFRNQIELKCGDIFTIMKTLPRFLF